MKVLDFFATKISRTITMICLVGSSFVLGGYSYYYNSVPDITIYLSCDILYVDQRHNMITTESGIVYSAESSGQLSHTVTMLSAACVNGDYETYTTYLR